MSPLQACGAARGMPGLGRQAGIMKCAWPWGAGRRAAAGRPPAWMRRQQAWA